MKEQVTSHQHSSEMIIELRGSSCYAQSSSSSLENIRMSSRSLNFKTFSPESVEDDLPLFDGSPKVLDIIQETMVHVVFYAVLHHICVREES